MSLIRRSLLTAAIVAGMGLTACQRETAAPGAAPAAAVAKLDEAATARAAAAIAAPAWLRERLPEHTVGYLRIPSPWGLTAAPNGRALDAAFASEAHTRLIADLRAGIANDPVLQQAGAAPALALLLDDLAGPVELAVVDGSDIMNPASHMFVSAPLKLADVAALNARLASLKLPALAQPLDADGKGKLSNNGFVRFDAATKRLYALFGMAASAPALDLLIQQTAQTRAHPMHATEKDVDVSGQGLFYWMSVKGVTGMASAQIASAKPGTAVRDLLDRGQSIAAGWGTVGTRGRLQVLYAAPGARLLSYFAPRDFNAALRTAGRPEWAMTMALPSSAQIAQIEANLDADFGPGTRDAYATMRKAMQTAVGVDPMELLGALGGNLVAFEDEAGVYSALQVKDRGALYTKLDEFAAKLGWTRDTVTIGKTSIHHLHMPSKATMPAQTGGADAWLKIYSRIGTHAYWVEDGDFLVFADVPQALADRADATLDNDLGQWLRANQSYDPNTTLVGLTGKTRNAQRKIYYAYLAGLQHAADALGQKIDLAGLPHAATLGLPVEGATGLALDATPDRIGLSLTYEQNPAEVLFGTGGVAAVATAGILAAIAVPAYQDYTARAQVSQVVADADSYKAAIAAYYGTKRKLPASDDDLDLDLGEFGESIKYLESWYVDDGAIVLHFGDEANKALKDQTLVLTPYRLDGELVWQCGNASVSDDAKPISETAETTTVSEKLLPASCKP
ncbi:MAG TPA: pilin [Tahibacter sp.]|uniref:pilin n=1 Tax=Tahibacter sp. TaxID=2056211 RepID=UPI002B92C3DE|nr:pilin [Tahibacter sp.]HSX59606.1 pilin [Tahibacter sp.]